MSLFKKLSIKKMDEDKQKELIQKYNLDIKKLESEQEKLAKNIILKDNIDFSLSDRVAGIDSFFVMNNIISAIVVMNEEIIEQEYYKDKIRFPYLPGFRAYRELGAMINAFNMLDERPDVVFVHGHGIVHERGLGIASHFSLLTGIPTIGISDSIEPGIEDKDNIILNGKIVGKIIKTKEGSNPIYVSVGNLISLDSAVKLVMKYIKDPHKIPEPLRLAKKYAKDAAKEILD